MDKKDLKNRDINNLLRHIILDSATLKEWELIRITSKALLYVNPTKKIKFAILGISTKTNTHLFSSKIRIVLLEGEVQTIKDCIVFQKLSNEKLTFAIFGNKIALYEGEWPRDRTAVVPTWDVMHQNGFAFCDFLVENSNDAIWSLIDTTTLEVSQNETITIGTQKTKTKRKAESKIESKSENLSITSRPAKLKIGKRRTKFKNKKNFCPLDPKLK